ncbi:MAG: tRNA pseudouridine(38-40) synthase TruA [Candidatus Muirbacterium halophilum]|nr:tRNA pseudouridine(38-40) synthase TruA [Candidatus Muirbacterium halophilum]MCK9475038.1 tRNA pseudouridine(38-40) synthase TruA [Candidatus Muirbacterium halophilum]
MKHYAFKISYNGRFFHGSQVQKNVSTVQEKLEEALSYMTSSQIKTYFASRTDSGVHAYGNYVNISTDIPVPPERFYDLNRKMKYINIEKVFEVDENFSARYSNYGKTYMYIIDNSPSKNPLESDFCWHIDKKLDIDEMKKACKYFVGEHDFVAFGRKKFKEENTIKKITRCRLVTGSNKIYFFITGNGFLYNMIRIMIHSLHAVGRNKISSNRIKDMLECGNKYNILGKAQPGGLYLVNIYYNKEMNLIRRKDEQQNISSKKRRS